MAKWQIDAMLDAALSYITSNATEMYICDSQPGTRAAAITASAIAAVVPTFQAIANGAVDGRKVDVDAKADRSITSSKTVTHIALCSGTVLLYVTTCTSQALVSGNTVTIPAWTITLRDAT